MLEKNKKNNNKYGITVLYVDDDKTMLDNFYRLYCPYFNIYITDSTEHAKSILSTQDIHIIISDQRMPGITGVEFFRSILEKYPDPIRILLTGFTEIDVIINAINIGHIYQFIRKPYLFMEMKKILLGAGEIYQMRKNKKYNLNEI